MAIRPALTIKKHIKKRV